MASAIDIVTPPWKIGIDIGGTFTDIVLVDANGDEILHKVQSNPANPAEALLTAWDELAMRIGKSPSYLAENCSSFIHGTTIATNILLERNGAKAALLTTHGFRDSLEFRRGMRTNVWDHRTPWADPLVPRRFRMGIFERISADGEILHPVSEEDLRKALAVAAANEIQTIGICFLNAYRNPENEQRAKDFLLRENPSLLVSASHEVAPVLGEYERSSTVAVNCYVGPKVIPYLESIRAKLRSFGYQREPYFVQSSGGTISFEHLKARPAVLALSGPAAGANALVRYAKRIEQPTLVSVEIGGTSCDMTIVHEGAVAEQPQFRVGDEVIALPSVDIQTIAVGGGTIPWVDAGGMLQLGPQSAGARPGPAAFGLGGTRPTITDAQLVLGRLKAGHYAGGKIALRQDLAEAAIEEHVAKPLSLSTAEAAIAVVRLAEQRVRNAVERLCFERGLDPTEITLLAGGGAGPMHAFGIGRALGCSHLLVPRVAGVLCAYGMCHAEIRHDLVADLGVVLNHPTTATGLTETFARLRGKGLELLAVDGIAGDKGEIGYFIDARYRGQPNTLRIKADWPISQEMLFSAFEEAHEREYGFSQPGGQVDVVNARVVASSPSAQTAMRPRPRQTTAPAASDSRKVWVDESRGFSDLPVYDSSTLGSGSLINGPCIVESTSATAFIGGDAQVLVDEGGNLHIELEA